MSQLTNTFSDLLPFRIPNADAIVNFYSFNGYGSGGRFVSFETGNQDPALSAGEFSAASPGATVEGAISLVYEQPRKVKYAAYGELKSQVLGLALDSTVEYDENGQKVRFHPEVQNEKQIVPSGTAIRVATDGVFTLRKGAYVGTPIPGYVGIVTGTFGQLTFVPPANAQPYITSGLDVCKVLSSSGSAFGGYVQIKLT
jgi:hypothetical protein